MHADRPVVRPGRAALAVKMRRMRPIVGISCDVIVQPRTLGGAALGGGRGARRHALPVDYARAVHAAGGAAVLLPHHVEAIDAYLARCDAFVLAGGDDPDTTAFGAPPHEDAVLIDADRQRFELALLGALDAAAQPVLGVCLGMQLMALHHGGRLCQSIGDAHGPAAAARHADADHAITADPAAPLPAGATVYSCHRQAISDPGAMTIAARCADDDLIEAIALPGQRFYLGVQWHPERSIEPAVGVDLFGALIASV